MPTLIKKRPDGLLFSVYVQPRSAQNAIIGFHDQTLKIRITAPPVDEAANKMCIRFLAKQLNVPKSALQIESGHNSRYKTIFCRCEEMLGSKIECARIKAALQSLF